MASMIYDFPCTKFYFQEKPDKLMGTYKTDPEFENFLAKLEVPVQVGFSSTI